MLDPVGDFPCSFFEPSHAVGETQRLPEVAVHRVSLSGAQLFEIAIGRGVIFEGPLCYQLIGTDEQRLRGAVAVVIDDKYVLTLSNRSKHMRYCSLQLTIEVRGEEHRIKVFEDLKHHDDILYVL